MRVKHVGITLMALAMLALTLPTVAQSDKDSEGLGPEAMAALIKAVSDRMVVVEYKLKYDKGSEPFVDSDVMLSGNGYSRTLNMLADYSPETCLSEERPFEVAGMPISPTEILTPDLAIHERFIESIKVRLGDKAVAARVKGVCADRPAAILELAEPLEGLRPVAFAASDAEQLYAVVTRFSDGAWKYIIAPMTETLEFTDGKARLMAPPPGSVVLDADGRVVTISYAGKLPLDDSWKAPPKTWPFIEAERIGAMADSMRQVFESSVAVVRLSFRSPTQEQDRSRYYGRGEDDETEKYSLGAILDDTRILVCEDLSPKVTARLESINVTLPGGDGEMVEAEFICSLKDYGAFLARLPKPMGKPIRAWQGKLSDKLLNVLMSVEVKLQGEAMDVHTLHRRFTSIDRGFHGFLSPQLDEPEASVLLYDLDGRLLALPEIRRSKNSDEYRYRSSQKEGLMTASELAGFIYGDLAGYVDPDNVPLSEEQELRLAWLGVELQPLDRELARINKVSAYTDDGSYGCLVSYVYKDSPAAEAGIRLGDVLIRMKSDEWPMPKQITLENYIDPSYFMRLWEHMDEIPEEYFERIPMPWPSAENSVTRALTDLGFGRTFTLEYARAGEVMSHDFQVVQSPPHYLMARKFKSEPLGLTVRNLTFEVRRYFQRPEGQPGVVVSKVEPGSRASVSGVKPFEIITHVNGEPVMNVDDFQRLAAAGDLTLQIKRMTKGRVVSIKAVGGETPSDAESNSAAPSDEATPSPAAAD